ncbi:GDSL esterase/lipase CPRD49 [Linum perenne]
MVGPVRPQFVLFGSSIVEMSFTNGGWGAILSHIYSRKDAQVQPALIIVYFGGNDSIHSHETGLGPHVPLPEFVDNMKKIILHLKSLSDKTRLIFLTAPPVAEDLMNRDFWGSIRSNESCRVYSEATMKVCEEMGVKGIDLWTSMQKAENWKQTCFTDGIHLAEEGSRVVAKQILDAIKDADWEPSLYCQSMPTEFAEDSPYDPLCNKGKPINLCSLYFQRIAPWE